MASRWRIRHKLMLGLGLVVATMSLLLGGTVFGLWSYYLDMNSLRSKTTQLQLAEKIKSDVGHLARLVAAADALRINDSTDGKPPQPASEPRPFPKMPPFPADGNEGMQRQPIPTTPRQAIRDANKDLDNYETYLKESGDYDSQSVNNVHAAYIQELRDAFRKMSETLEKKEQRARQIEEKQDLVVDMFFGQGNVTVDLEERRRQAERMQVIELKAADLCDFIYIEMHRRINDSRRNYQITLWIAVPTSVVGLLLICGMLGSFYAWVFYPIRDLGEGVARVAKGDFEHRIEVRSGDEMEDLGAAFNDMMQRLQDFYSDLARQVNERSRQLVRSERLASVGFLAAGVAHEINNPLASIAFCSEALEARLGDLLRHLRASGKMDEEHEVFSKYLKMIQEEAFRCKNITERLLAFSRPGEQRRENADLRELVQLVLDVTQHLPNHRGKEISFEMNANRLGGSSLTAWVNSEEIKSVVLNLVVNALDSMDEGGKLTIRLSQRGDMAELQFTDTGCGMNQEVLENIFEPFYTRSRTGKGTGLGLTISHRIITQHGGEIEASSPGPSKGSTFIVRLPIKAPEGSPTLPGPGVDPSRREEQAMPARAA
ncbi:MAG TPA: ATP-binding protein [Gemmataceae bacterium]